MDGWFGGWYDSGTDEWIDVRTETWMDGWFGGYFLDGWNSVYT